LNAKRATTYFVKKVVDNNWDTDTLNKFVNKLADYSIKIKEYVDSCIDKDFQDLVEDQDDKIGTTCSVDDAILIKDKSQSNFIANNITTTENTRQPLIDLDFELADGGMILQKPTAPKATISTTDFNTQVSTEKSSRLYQEPQHQEQENQQQHQAQQKQQRNQQQQHCSNTFPSPSIVSPNISNMFEQITPTKRTPKRLRFELNNEDLNIDPYPSQIFAILKS
jgi:hypothetical protein